MKVESNGSTQDIGFVNNELDVASIESFCGSNVGTVHTWYDQSGNNNHATQTTTTKQPQIYNGSAVLTENGKPTMSFDGSNDTIEVPLNVSGGSTLCAYYACTYISGPNYGPDIGVLTSTGVDNGALHYVKSNLTGASYPFYNEFNGILFGSYDGAGSYSSGTMYLIAAEFPGSSPWSVYKNGSYEGGSTTYSTFNTTQTGFTLALQEDIARQTEANFSEVIFYTSDQSSNRAGIESNINAYYNIYNSTPNSPEEGKENYKLAWSPDNLAVQYVANATVSGTDITGRVRGGEDNPDAGAYELYPDLFLKAGFGNVYINLYS
jgi:hypothetical protein